MAYGQETGYSGGNVIEVINGNSGNGNVENWIPGSTDQAVWSTEDDYGVWNREASVDAIHNSTNDPRQPQMRSESEPPNKRSRNSQLGDLPHANRSRAIGKMFFKTKLCGKFRAGNCPYITNCNFAHSIEELRRPPPNWQELVAVHEEERTVSAEPREEFQIPALDSSGFGGDTQRSFKGRHCKRFYSEEGCPYGDSCTFLHDEQSKARESVTISLGPSPGTGGGGYGGGSSGSILKGSNWKTRICNKWELTGYCPFGSKCHFAHGVGELHRYGGEVGDTEANDSSSAPSDPKQGQMPLKMPAATVNAQVTSAAHSDGYHVGVPSQRFSNAFQKTGQKVHNKWKYPGKIIKIYGDWIDDDK